MKVLERFLNPSMRSINIPKIKTVNQSIKMKTYLSIYPIIGF